MRRKQKDGEKGKTKRKVKVREDYEWSDAVERTRFRDVSPPTSKKENSGADRAVCRYQEKVARGKQGESEGREKRMAGEKQGEREGTKQGRKKTRRK